MPNWCENVITIKTDNPQGIINDYFNGEDFDFERLVPTPKHKKDCPKDCFVNKDSHIEIDTKRPWFNWYEWKWKYWGTKWNACDTSYNIENNKITIAFNTAWCPPIPILNMLITRFGHSIAIKSYEECEGLVFKKNFKD